MERVPLLTFASLANVGGGAAVDHDHRRGLDCYGIRADEAVMIQAFNDLALPLPLHVAAVRHLDGDHRHRNIRDVNPEPTSPRWLAYYNLYARDRHGAGKSNGPVQTGPLAYNGILAFWVVAVDFSVWMVVMSVAMMRVIGKASRDYGTSPI